MNGFIKFAAVAGFALCLVAQPSCAQDETDAFAHSDKHPQLTDELKADLQSHVEDLLALSTADAPQGGTLRKKLIGDLLALAGKDPTGGSEDSGATSASSAGADMKQRREDFSKHGWQDYMAYVKQSVVFLGKIQKAYQMGDGLVAMKGQLTEGTERYWLGDGDKENVVFIAQGKFECREEDVDLCDNGFRIHITFTPQDPEAFSDLVINDWVVEFLNDKGRPVGHD